MNKSNSDEKINQNYLWRCEIIVIIRKGMVYYMTESAKFKRANKFQR